MLVIITAFSLKQQLLCQPILTFFMRPALKAPTEENAEKLSQKITKPGHIAKKSSNLNHYASVHGIFSTYAGFLAMSNNFGQTSFPLKHAVALIYLIITPKISPVMMAGNTIHHWELEPGIPAKIYKLERHYIEQDDIYYWQTEEVPLPENNIIPLESVTILAQPKHIIVPEGISLTQKTANLLLPDVLVTKALTNDNNALYLLNIKHFFGHLHPMYKRGVNRYLVHTHES